MCQVLSPLLCCFKAGETVEAASWLEVSSSLMLHSSHLYYVQLVAEKLNAFFWKANHGILHNNLKMLIMECIHTWKLFLSHFDFAGLIIHIVFVIEIYFTYKDLIEKPIDELMYIRFTVIDSSAFFGSILVGYIFC